MLLVKFQKFQGQRCHGGMQAFGSYENASKQFERSVNAVQKILGSTVFELPHRTKKFSPRASPLKEETSEEPEALDTLKTIQEREQYLLQTDRKLSPLEQNFVDLAKISTAKDVIIDQQRTEMQNKTELLQKSEAESKVVQSRCEELEARLKAMDEELNMLRKMGCEQEYLGDKVKELSSHLLNKEAELARTREELEAKCTRLSDELREAREKSSSLALNLETATEKSSELAEQLQNAIVSRDLLNNELTQLRPLARAVDIEMYIHFKNADGVIAYLDAVENAKRHQAEAAQAQAAVEEIKTRYDELSELQTNVIKDNTRLHERNAELEAQAEKFNGEIQNLNEDWKRKLEKEKMEWDQAHREIETECAQMKKQLVDLQDVLATVTRDATENSRRASEMQRSRDELKRALEMAELKVQEPLKRKIRTLSDDLRESELKVSELTGLVASLTADAHNSQRDIGDILK
ncbi:unnamed protein product [Haemonchus placei]|uniref:MICOS complex subunit MIC60 n=1 Tax=Haemonchus placei TaxID=6290 RepID=A0A158QPE9_HAEPC|nr:unnamed protein product [Haemonchus placei]